MVKYFIPVISYPVMLSTVIDGISSRVDDSLDGPYHLLKPWTTFGIRGPSCLHYTITIIEPIM